MIIVSLIVVFESFHTSNYDLNAYTQSQTYFTILSIVLLDVEEVN